MLTTLGSSFSEIRENWVESCCGDGTLSGVASDALFSWPLTPKEITLPITIPTANVATITNVDARRWALKRSHRARMRESISGLPSMW